MTELFDHDAKGMATLIGQNSIVSSFKRKTVILDRTNPWTGGLENHLEHAIYVGA